MNGAKVAALEAALKVVAAASIVVAAVSLSRLPLIGFQPGMVLHALAPIALLTAWRWPRRLSVNVLTGLLVTTLLAYGYNGLLALGTLDVNSLLFMGAVLLSAANLPRSVAAVVAVIVSITIFWAEMQQGLHPLTALVNYTAWAVILGLLALSFWIYDKKLNEALEASDSRNQKLLGANKEFGELSTQQRNIFLAMDESGLGLATFDRRSGRLREHNQSFNDCVGSGDGWLPKHFQELLDRLEPIPIPDWDQTEYSGLRYCYYLHPDGSREPFVVSDNHHSHGSDAAEIVVMMRSATRMVHNQIALRASEQKLEIALRARRLHLYEYDPQADRATLSPELRQMLGLAEPGKKRIRFADLVATSSPRQAKLLTRLRDELISGKVRRHEQGEFHFVAANGSTVWLSLAAEMSSGITEDGHPILIGTAEDITQRKNLELALIENREAASAAYLAKRQLLMTFGLEVRLLVNRLFGHLQRLRASNVDDAIRQDVAAALNINEAISELIDHVVDITSDTRESSDSNTGRFFLADVLESVQQILAFDVEQRGGRLNISVDSNVPSRLDGDYRSLTQLLLNLAGNAITHGEGRDINIRIEIPDDGLGARDSDTPVNLRIVVTDPTWQRVAESPGQIYEVDDASLEKRQSRKIQGAHLDVSSSLAERLGGTLHLRELEDGGVAFWLDLNFALPVGADTDIALTRSWQGNANADNQDPLELFFQQSRVLVVDDDHLTLLALTRSLGLMGADVNTCQDGLSALQIVREDEPYDLILMDLIMPVLDGFEATTEIRRLQSDDAGKHLLILGMANTPEEAATEQVANSGMDGCLTKPVSPEEIYSLAQATKAQAQLQQLSN